MATQIHGGKHYYDPAKAALSAFNMSLLPVLYFFSFLYYTDVGSTLMVLLAYCLHLDGRDVLLNICNIPFEFDFSVNRHHMQLSNHFLHPVILFILSLKLSNF